ncbi:MAG: hypothetical protein ACO34E_15410, partial [Limisphaerales bacterium]
MNRFLFPDSSFRVVRTWILFAALSMAVAWLAGGTKVQAYSSIRGFYEEGETAAKYSLLGSFDVVAIPGREGLAVRNYSPVVYLDGNGKVVGNASSADWVAFVRDPKESQLSVVVKRTAVWPFQDDSVTRGPHLATGSAPGGGSIYFDGSGGAAMRSALLNPLQFTGFPYYVTSVDSVASLNYTLVEREFDVQVESRVVGSQANFRPAGSVHKSLSERSVWDPTLGYVPGFRLERPNTAPIYATAREGAGLGLLSVPDSNTRYKLLPNGFEFYSNGKQRRKVSGDVSTADLAVSTVKSGDRASMRWLWSAQRYRLITMREDYEWIEGLTVTNDLTSVGLSVKTNLVAPEVNRVFERPATLYLDEDLQNPTLTKTANTVYVATPSGWRCEITNASGNSTIFSSFRLGDASLKVPLNLSHNASGDDSQYLSGVFTWLYRVEQQQVAITVTSSGLPEQFILPPGAVSPGNDQYPTGKILQFGAASEVYWDADLRQTSTNYFEGARYRAVLRRYGVSDKDSIVEGSTATFTLTVPADDMQVNWEWELEYAVTLKSDVGDGGDPLTTFGSQSYPGVTTHWVPGDTLAVFSVQRANTDGAGTSRTAVQGFKVNSAGGEDERGIEEALLDAGRVSSPSYVITDWMEFEWKWAGEVKYTFDSLTIGSGVPLPAGQAFVRTYPAPGDPGEPKVYFSTGQNDAVWIQKDSDIRVEVGCFYRSLDRRWTLADFPLDLLGDLQGRGGQIVEASDDEQIYTDPVTGEVINRVARVYSVAEASKSTDIHWYFKPTVFRAEVALGEALNPGLFVPALPDDAVLSASGPEETYQTVVEVGAGLNDPGSPCRWDRVSALLYPVHPGSFQTNWEDAAGDERYQIEVVAGFPGDVMPLGTAREDLDGRRQTSSEISALAVLDDDGSITGNYYVLKTPAMPDVEAVFPAAPAAHYRQIIDPDPQRGIPSSMDPSVADEWKFVAMTFTEEEAELVDTSVAGVPFKPLAEGRNVMLFSHRPNPDEIATGDFDREQLAVRVVSTIPLETIEFDAQAGQPEDERLVLGRRSLILGAGRQPGEVVGVVSTNGVGSTVDLGSHFIVDFWLNAAGFGPADWPVTLVATGGDVFSITLDNHLSEVDIELAVESGEVVVPFAFGAAEVLKVENVSTGETLEQGMDYVVASGGSGGRSSGVITLMNTAATGVGDVLRL